MSRGKYSAAVQVTRNEQLLLNLVRLRYRDIPSFLELSSLATQFNFDNSVGITGTIKENSQNFNVLGLSAGGAASERPTASYTPVQGADFVTRLLTPIDEETIVLLTRSGWKGERVFRTAVQSLNGLANMRSASGPTPLVVKQSEINDTLRFRELVQTLEQYSENKIVRFNYETVEIPKSATMLESKLTPEHAVAAAESGLRIINPHKKVSLKIDQVWLNEAEVDEYSNPELLEGLVEQIKNEGLQRPIRVRRRQDSATGALQQPFEVVDDELVFQAVREIHEADESGEQYSLVPCDIITPNRVVVAGTKEKFVMTWDADYNESVEGLRLPNLSDASVGRYLLQIEPRSLMGAMYFLSHAVCVPPEHQTCGLVVLTTDEIGEPFEWWDVSGDLLAIKYCKKCPDCAAMAVHYRGYWFYIDDRDHSSKATFALLMQLFELQAGGGTGQGPVLTLPVGI